ncbi:MAG: ScaI family restriction endonuclease [Chloroflexi bacterium]|nr:ScaI family restriction endonuclease [Chloroflexota bacterium]
MTKSPYDGVPVNKWKEVTQKLIANHPLSVDFLVKTILNSWQNILNAQIDSYYIGRDIIPKPQIMAFFLHELIPLKIQNKFPDKWRVEKDASDKDIVCIFDPKFSIEIKASSSSKNIYGNRSYSQATSSSKKSKSGYYLAINFEKFNELNLGHLPKITLIRFGWLDHEDWQGQKASSGQQARLSPEVEQNKLLVIYSRDN